MCSAPGAVPDAELQIVLQLAVDKAALGRGTGLRGGVELPGTEQQMAAGGHRLVQVGHKRAPTEVVDALGQAGVLAHEGKLQGFDARNGGAVGHRVGGLPQVGIADVGDTGVNFPEYPAGLLPPSTALLSSGDALVGLA